MQRRLISRLAGSLSAAALLASAGFLVGAGGTGAAPPAGTNLIPAGVGPNDSPTGGHADPLYVSPSGSPSNPDKSCASAAYTMIAPAVAAAPSGGTVVVCKGTYAESVLLSQPLALIGHDASINAAGQPFGIIIDSSHVTVSGFSITGALGAGIAALPSGALAAIMEGGQPGTYPPVSDVRLLDNNVSHDDNAYVPPQGCPPNIYPGDCGGGVLLDAVAHSLMSGNVVESNVDGILLVDDFGPSFANLLIDNRVEDNVNECGITLPSHNGGAASYVANANGLGYHITHLNPSVGGVYDNAVIDNVADGNGTAGFKNNLAGSGAGILLAAGAVPGSAVYDNLVADNEMQGNGLAGLTFHLHYMGGVYMGGNRVVDNRIGRNNVSGDTLDAPLTAADFETTGIILFSATPLSVEVAGNHISDDHYGIWATPNVGMPGGGNSFHDVAVPRMISQQPYGSALTAVSVTSDSATLLGFGVPNGHTTTTFFDWGTAPIAFFTATPPQKIGSGTGMVPVSATLHGLSANTTYYFQLVLSNDFGTAEGVTISFTTT